MFVLEGKKPLTNPSFYSDLPTERPSGGFAELPVQFAVPDRRESNLSD
jgi:hypothetical protein